MSPRIVVYGYAGLVGCVGLGILWQLAVLLVRRVKGRKEPWDVPADHHTL